jgi:hypothetical protein
MLRFLCVVQLDASATIRFLVQTCVSVCVYVCVCVCLCVCVCVHALACARIWV